MENHLEIHKSLTDILGFIDSIFRQILSGDFYGLTKGLFLSALYLSKDDFYLVVLLFYGFKTECLSFVKTILRFQLIQFNAPPSLTRSWQLSILITLWSG